MMTYYLNQKRPDKGGRELTPKLETTVTQQLAVLLTCVTVVEQSVLPTS